MISAVFDWGCLTDLVSSLGLARGSARSHKALLSQTKWAHCGHGWHDFHTYGGRFNPSRSSGCIASRSLTKYFAREKISFINKYIYSSAHRMASHINLLHQRQSHSFYYNKFPNSFWINYIVYTLQQSGVNKEHVSA